MNKSKKIILISLKSLAILLLIYLLFNPVWNIKTTRTEKPIIVLAQDNSSSINEASDYKNDLKTLAKAISKDYDLKIITFGSKVTPLNAEEIDSKVNFKDYCSDISQAIATIGDQYADRNLSSIVLATDGIANRGSNPLNACENLHFPILTLALGDTTIRKDLFISEVRYNKLVYKGSDFPLEIVTGATKAKGSHSAITVSKNGKIIFDKPVNIDDNNFTQTFSTIVNADKVGMERYMVEVKTIDNEKNVSNNRREIFIEVIDGKQKVLILAASPHPDISALKSGLLSNQNYDVKTALIDDLPTDFLKYNMVILHNLPSNRNNANTIKQLAQNNVPLMFILGSQTNLPLLNSLSLGFTISQSSAANANQSLALFNPDFALFSLSKTTETIIRSLPPLICPIAKISTQSAAQTLAFQKIGSVNTDYPLLSYYNVAYGRIALLAGENIWKWRLQNYSLNQTHQEVDEIIQKSVKLIANKIDKSRFRIICDRIFNENQPISLQAELYNEAYELINDSEVTITIKNSQNKAYDFTFGKTFNAYHLNAGRLPAGHYQYEAKTTSGGRILTAKGSFDISKEDLEQINLTADHSLLYNISAKTAGKMFYPDNMQQILDFLKANEQIKPVIYQSEENISLISRWWYWLCIVLLLSAAWGLRKYWGNN
ncbi:MAG: hypothetical protein LBL74_00420 [Bacteroidales bacterium]|jgi:hypothetical protein|nr:hypothetical protein [Bacteroidales bacterium]